MKHERIATVERSTSTTTGKRFDIRASAFESGQREPRASGKDARRSEREAARESTGWAAPVGPRFKVLLGGRGPSAKQGNRRGFLTHPKPSLKNSENIMARIATRLAKLEDSTGSKELSVESLRLLVSLLGRLDALWWPFRTHTGSYRAEIRRMQLEYLSGTGCLRAASQGETNWKAAHHARNELIGAGLANASLSGGQVVGLRLTARGLADAIAMVGDRLQRLVNRPTLTLLVILRKFEGCSHSAKWMLENNLFGADVCKGTNPSDWDHAIEYLLPLLRCGLIESTSDLWNRCYFMAVDGVDIQDEPTSKMQAQPWADSAYVSAFNSERDALLRCECLDGGIYIPMRCT